MTAVFSRRGVLVVKLAVLGLAGLVALTIFVLAWRAHAYEQLGEPIAQPIPFSHKHHVGDDGIDCRFCHTTVETDAHAGLPSTAVCLTCHSQLFRDQPLLSLLHESAASNRPIAWQRVHVLPDFVFFNHGVHVAKGVACVECHGRVDQMPLEWRAQPLQMQWCLDCHRDPAPHLRPLFQEFRMDAPRATPAAAGELAREAHLESRRRMTDCSTCHR
jgi:NAD-dependent SIR2 family protein deacetylase